MESYDLTENYRYWGIVQHTPGAQWIDWNGNITWKHMKSILETIKYDTIITI